MTSDSYDDFIRRDLERNIAHHERSLAKKQQQPHKPPAPLPTAHFLSQVPGKPLTWLWPARIPLGHLTLLDPASAIPGLSRCQPALLHPPLPAPLHERSSLVPNVSNVPSVPSVPSPHSPALTHSSQSDIPQSQMSQVSPSEVAQQPIEIPPASLENDF